MQASLSDPVLIDIIWARVEPTSFLSKQQFVYGMEGWKISPVWIGGEIAFVTATNGPAFHFQSMGTGHKLSRGMITDFLGKIIAEHGYATTRTPKDDERQNRFNRLFGFTAVGEDTFDIHYRIERLR